jgi:uncharacterized protein (TIGR00645 family)
MVELYHLIIGIHKLNQTDIMLQVLDLIDIVMIANLLIMVIVGEYQIFVSRLDLENHPDQPEWLDHVNSGSIKIKFSMALIGISSIHLLKTFIGVEHLTQHAIMWQVLIHLTFIVSAIALAFIDKLILENAHTFKKEEKPSPKVSHEVQKSSTEQEQTKEPVC